MDQPDWDSYRSLLAVLEEGSLSAAARRLGLTQPTIGRHVQGLEQALGQPLFVRSQRGLTPTALAVRLRPYAEAVRASAQAVTRAAADQGEAGATVRISASEVVAAEVLPFILQPLSDRRPGLQLEVDASNRQADLLSRAADIAVRMVRPTQQALIAVRCGAVALGLYAAPAYVSRWGVPDTLGDLGAHRLIGFDQETDFIRRMRAAHPFPPREAFTLRTDNDAAAIGALRAGFGIGACQAGIARREGWVRVLPAALAAELEVWVAMHEDLKANPACRHTFDALAEGLKRYCQVSGPTAAPG